MISHAGQLGANAVIGVRYDATEISAGHHRSALLWHGGVCRATGLNRPQPGTDEAAIAERIIGALPRLLIHWNY